MEIIVVFGSCNGIKVITLQRQVLLRYKAKIQFFYRDTCVYNNNNTTTNNNNNNIY
jgi:hypothetical protein